MKFEENKNYKSFDACKDFSSVYADATSCFSDTAVCNVYDNVVS